MAFPASGPEPDLCLVSPCGSYDGRAAAAYAIRWKSGHNIKYPYLGGNGGDCTNFPSQAIHAGGMRFMRAGGRNDPLDVTGGHVYDFKHGTGSWWSHAVPTVHNTFPSTYDWTASWTNADIARTHYLEYGLMRALTGSERPKPGDVVFYKLKGLDKPWDHSQVVAKVTKTQIWVVQHSPGYNEPFSQVKARNDTPSHRLGVDWTFQFLRPILTGANI